MAIDTEKYKKLLEEERALIERELKQVGVFDKENNDWIPARDDIDSERTDHIDTADNVEEYATHEAITNELEARLMKIRDALERIKQGTYGICRVCGITIEEKRLDADPTATTCIAHRNET